MLDRADVYPSTTCFVDLGCGKGRVVLLAAQRPFRRVLGVEISAVLAEIARSNVDRFRPAEALLAPVDILEADVTTVDLPEDDLLLHLYHPFETSITERVLQRLETSRAAGAAPSHDRLPGVHGSHPAGARSSSTASSGCTPCATSSRCAVSTTGCCTRPER